jgi:hypothetical protein
MLKTAPNDDHQEMGVGRNKSRKFMLVFPQKTTGQVVFREDAKFADVRFHPCLSHQSLQPGAQSNFPIKFQAEPDRRSR